ncbi:glycosyltransferase family 4 protein [Vibrio owensii]|uniref:glycosyltransferase family 4 protein n=1 Tax=Vibrio owensii TaxID=696485 RepID=UPI002F3E3569
MRKIVFFVESLGSGGAERVLTVVANFFSENGWDVTIYVSTKETVPFYKVSESVKLVYLDFSYDKKGVWEKTLEQFRRIMKIRRILKSKNNHIVIGFLSHMNVRLLISSIFTGNKIFCCEHNHYNANRSKLFKYFKILSYIALSERISVLTERDYKSYPRLLKRKLYVLPNPLGIEVEIINKKNKYKERKIILLAIGRLCEQKGFDRLLEIISEFKLRYPSVDFELKIAGDGKLRHDLESTINEFGLKSSVMLLGNVQHIENLYCDADVFLMTSRWEGLPMVLGEAMMYGLPTVAYDCPTGPREFIVNGKSGLLIPDGHKNEFVEALYYICMHDDIRKDYSKYAKDASKKYSMKNIYKNWLEFLRLDK